MNREKFEAWGMSDVDLRITLESETYAGIAWMAWQAATASMQAERDQLAAENAALKHAMSVTMEHVSVMDAGQAGVAAMIINDALHNSETPATDRFLADQRAQGVEMFAEKCSSKSKQAISSDTRDSWWLCGEHASDFAVQLRNEVKL